MSKHPDHAAFDLAAVEVANELAFGLHPEYNHGFGRVCAVGLVKTKMGIPSEEDGDSSEFIRKVTGMPFVGSWACTDSPLHRLYGTRRDDGNTDQYAGSRRIFEYLKEMEEVS